MREKPFDPPCYLVNPVDGTELVLLPGGWFWMGSDDGEPDALVSEKPRHLHYVAPYYLGIHCVTVGQFRRFVKKTGYAGGIYPSRGSGWNERWGYWENDPPDHPIRHVNRHDAAAYCEWAGLRLPNEAEWELAARGYGALKYPWGNDWEEGSRVCWYGQKGPKGNTAPVFEHPGGASRFGCFQQSGNVWEWCADAWGGDAYKRYAQGDLRVPDQGDFRVLRGGSWHYDYPRYFRGGYRRYSNYSPANRSDDDGFRAAGTVTF
ncbi:formylglycine-generating enzyme family protein [Desulfococcus sp.]|uniref:formylglycine-generating enzyme family protein n=1 Tax=Desulfococcus sp. TaxID=2025834 RepID=UPI003592F12E